MGPMEWIALATLASGVLRDMKENSAYNRQVELAATRERWSPFTGVHGELPSKQPGMLNNTMQAGMSTMMSGAFSGGGQGTVPLSEGPVMPGPTMQNAAAMQQPLDFYAYRINPQFSRMSS